MQFDFDKETLSNGAVEIENIGECALSCLNDDMEEYYLVISTVMGKSYIFQYGPIVQDLDTLDNISCSITTLDYTEPKLIKIIDRFINDYSKRIKYIEVLPKAEVLAKCRSIIQYMGGL